MLSRNTLRIVTKASSLQQNSIVFMYTFSNSSHLKSLSMLNLIPSSTIQLLHLINRDLSLDISNNQNDTDAEKKMSFMSSLELNLMPLQVPEFLRYINDQHLMGILVTPKTFLKLQHFFCFNLH